MRRKRDITTSVKHERLCGCGCTSTILHKGYCISGVEKEYVIVQLLFASEAFLYVHHGCLTRNKMSPEAQDER